MKRFAARYFLLIFPSLFASSVFAQAPVSHLKQPSSRASKNARVAPAQELFGAIQISTKSAEVRKSIEVAWDKYENAMYDAAVAQASHAAEKDPQSALSFAMISFAARRGMPDLSALAKAKALLPHATADEQLLVRWMTSIQDRNLLPAIMNMNNLLKRFPQDKHILYVTAEWLLLQQDYERARSMMETALQIDPNFPAVLNRLGYVYVEAGEPDPVKAIASLKRYAAVEPNSPNPEDSLGEVSRIAGDDRASLRHYSAALRIDPTYLASQIGLGDTRTLMGDFQGARKEYDRALKMTSNPRDEFYVKNQRALTWFWEGRSAEGHKALAAVAEEAAAKKEPYSQFDIGMARAMLSADARSELEQLRTLAAFVEQPLAGMLESDRGIARASVLRERVRVATLHGLSDEAAQAISKLEELAKSSRDLLVENIYESSRGYLLFLKGDLASAGAEFAADPHSPLALQRLAITQEKLGNASAAESARARFKYHREPTVEWYLASQQNLAASN